MGAEDPKESRVLKEATVVEATIASGSEGQAQPNQVGEIEDDCGSEAELIPGTLDESPPAGTLVRVLYDDDLWYPATVLTSRDTVIRVRFDTGKQANIDVAEHAVRLGSYVDEDECSESSDDSDEGEEAGEAKEEKATT